MKEYTPAYLDRSGNRLIFPTKKSVFPESGPAHAFQIFNHIGFLDLGLKLDGVVRIDGDCPNVQVTVGHFDAYCIGGPLLEEAKPNEPLTLTPDIRIKE